MTGKELSKFVNQRFAEGMTDAQIAGALGISVECMYRKMAERDESKEDTTESE